MPTDNGRDLRRAMERVIGFVSGWRAALIVVSVAAAFLIGFVAGGGSLAAATGAALVAAVVLGAVVVMVALEANRISEWSTRLAGVAEPARAADGRLDLIDAVVGGSTRQWRDPTLLPWPEDGGEAVVLLPGAAYHLAEVIPLSRELQRRGIPGRIAVGEPHWERVRDGLVDFDGPVFALPDPARTVKDAIAILAMKDWAGYRPNIETAQAAGIPTFAKVEGVQDFDEVDSVNRFEPYRTADHILCQGQNDYDALTGARTIVGNSRLERQHRTPLRHQTAQLAVINLNFTYGVRIDDRQQYLDTAIAGCEQAGIPYVVGAHPAERVGRGSGFTTIPISRLLEHATVLISR